MNIKKAIRKVAALGTGLGMAGATVFGALAADLSMWPKPLFVGEDGVFDGILVTGDSAISSDVVGMTNIMQTLQAVAYKEVPIDGSTATTVTVTGDSKKIGTASDMLEIHEPLVNVSDVLTSDDLSALADGKVTNEKGTFKYSQYLRFSSQEQKVVFDINDDDDEDIPGDFFYVKSGEYMYQYELTFDTSFESDITTNTGSSCSGTTCDTLYDLEDKDLFMLGQTFTIVDTDRKSGVIDKVELTLMAGSAKDTLEEGASKTYTIGDVEYEVDIMIVDDNAGTTKMLVNGELTNEMNEDDTYTLSDGTVIGIRSVMSNEAGDVTQDLVEFYLGAEKVKLKDTNTSKVGTGDSALEVNEETIQAAKVRITGTDDGSTSKIDKITVNATAEDDYYVAPGKCLTDEILSNEDEAEAVFTGNWDLCYEGLTGVKTTEIKLKPSGTNQYNLHYIGRNGNSIKLPLVYANATNTSLGDDDHKLHILENQNIYEDDYLILNHDNTDDDGYSYALQYRGQDVADNTLTFKDLGTGKSIEVSYTDGAAGTNDGSLILAGKEYYIDVGQDTSDDGSIKVDLDQDGSITAKEFPVIVTEGQAVINISKSSTQGHVVLEIKTLNDRIDNVDQGENERVRVNISYDTSDDSLDLGTGAANWNFQVSGNSAFTTTQADTVFNLEKVGDTDTYKEMTPYGALFKLDVDTSDADSLTITYPIEQFEPQVFITAGVVSTSEGGESGSVSKEPVAIPVSAVKLASEVASVTAQNAIVVGGPCANAAAASLMGNPADCVAGFEEGKAKIKLYEHANGKIALLVAGYGAMDTRRAAIVLTDFADYTEKLTGDEVEVTGTSLTQISVGEPAVMETTE